MIHMFKKHHAWLLTALYALLLLALSSIPNFSTDDITPAVSDKFWHTAGYMPLGFLLYFAIDLHPGAFAALPGFSALFLGIGYGTLNELYQYFVPGRAVDMNDLACNIAGVIIGTMLYLVFQKMRLAKIKSPYDR